MEVQCSYCTRAPGYVASCGEAMVVVCKHHVGAACAGWLYDMGRTVVEVMRLTTGDAERGRPMEQVQPSTRERREKEALAAADDYYARLEASPEFAGAAAAVTGVAGAELKTRPNALLRLAFADGYLRGQDTVPWREFADLKDEQRRCFERVTALRLVVRNLLDVAGADEPCRLDHHGYCQEHGVTEPCVVAEAKRVLEDA